MNIKGRYKLRFIVSFSLTCLLMATAGLLFACASSPSREEPEPGSLTADETEIVAFLGSYFASWSRGDMEAYRAHFHPQATITLLGQGQVRYTMARDPFVQMQGDIIARAREPMNEVMTGYSIDADDQTAFATVDWRLDDGLNETVGVDRFLLFRDNDGRWLIVSLAFYTTEFPADKESVS